MEGLGSLLFFAILFFIMMRWGCGSHMIHGHGSHSNDRDADHNKYIDPVCNMEVKADKGYGKMYGGTLYRFCSRSCLDKFDIEPQRYISKGGEHEV